MGANTKSAAKTPAKKTVKKKVLSRDEQISAEIARLKKIYKDLKDDAKSVVEPLVERAAFMRVALADMESQLMQYGLTEEFRQSDKVKPYMRKTPIADLYNNYNKTYQTLIKQLTDYLPKDIKDPQSKDYFDGF